MRDRNIRPGSDCPAPEQLTDIARGEAAGAERDRLMDHVVACGACSELLQILMELDRLTSLEVDAELSTDPGADLVPAQGAVLEAAPDHFEWPEVADADSYTIVLYDENDNPIWESEPVTSRSTPSPEAMRIDLEPGSSYAWRVFHTVAGKPHGSPHYRFRLASAED